MLSKLFKPRAPQPVKFEEGAHYQFSFASDSRAPKREVSAEAAVKRVAADIAALRSVVAEL
ncbi:hypothetical protein BSU04_11320 [Caballeronia sordidicola]|uniref:Uncharacterized protein n=1 Tax=Caballeronia sordidicola TaxID=196367 RepID=A0A226X6C5_CABSO|nr:hypothetical protein BSU04_11320 [Caballeronia sordidicola]